MDASCLSEKSKHEDTHEMKVNPHATKANWNEYRAPMDGHGTSCKQSVSTMEVDRRELLVYLGFEKLWQSGMAAKVKAENRPAMKWLNVKWQWTIISCNGKPRWARWTELQRTDTIVAFKKLTRAVLLMLTMFVAWAQIAKHNDIPINNMGRIGRFVWWSQVGLIPDALAIL